MTTSAHMGAFCYNQPTTNVYLRGVMQDDDMHTRMLRAEWEITALKDGQEKLAAAMTSHGERMNIQHKQVMDAITTLRNESMKEQGAAEARLKSDQERRDRVKWASVIIGAIGVLGGLGLWRNADASIMSTDPPIVTQHYAREVP